MELENHADTISFVSSCCCTYWKNPPADILVGETIPCAEKALEWSKEQYMINAGRQAEPLGCICLMRAEDEMQLALL